MINSPIALQVKGLTVDLFVNQAVDSESNNAIDCSYYNAVTITLEPLTAGASCDAAVEGSPFMGIGYKALPDINSNKTGITGPEVIECPVGQVWAKLRLSNVVGRWRAYGNGFFSPGMPRVSASIVVDSLSAISANMGTVTAGSIVIGSTNKIWLNDAADGSLAVGGIAKASAPFRVSNTGDLFASSATITGAITTGAGSSIGGSYLTSASITGDKLVNATVTATQIALATIAAANIISGTITATQIAAATILGSNIATATIAGSNIAAGTITAANILAATITASQIANLTITASQIANLTITATQIANATITAAQITNATITGGLIASATITGSNIAGGTITGSNISSATITGANIVDSTITGGLIANATITGANLVNATITATQIAAATITASQIASATITATQIAASTITGSNIAAATITGSNIAASTITAGLINVSTLAAIQANIGAATISDKLSMAGASSAIAIGTTPPTAATVGTGIWLDRTGVYGLNANAQNFKLDATTGQITATGATISGAVTATSGSFRGGITIGTGGSLSSGQSAYDTGTGFWFEYNAGTPRFSFGNSSGNHLTWDGTNFSVLLNGLGVGTASTADSKVRVSQAGNNNQEALYSESVMSAANGNTAIAVQGVGVTNHTSGSIQGLTGVFGTIAAQGSGGTVIIAEAVSSALSVSTGATVTSAYMLHALSPVNNGTISTLYGLAIDDLSGKASTVWAIHALGTAPSYFGGNVGVGVTPSYTTDIYGTSANGGVLQVARSSNDATVLIGGNAANTVAIHAIVGTKLSLGVGATFSSVNNFVNILSSAVGVGVASPTYPLEVQGLIRNHSGADGSPYTQARIVVYGGTGVDTANWGYFAYGADAQMRIVYSKNNTNALLFGYSTAMDGTGTFTTTITFGGGGGVRFHAYGAGTATFDANGVISSVSDGRLKNIQRQFAGDILDLAPPQVYKWRPESGLETEHEYMGWIAQDVQAWDKAAVGVNPEGYLSYQDRAIMAGLYNTVARQQREIDELKARLN